MNLLTILLYKGPSKTPNNSEVTQRPAGPSLRLQPRLPGTPVTQVSCGYSVYTWESKRSLIILPRGIAGFKFYHEWPPSK